MINVGHDWSTTDSSRLVWRSDGNWIGILVGGLNGSIYNSGPDLAIVLPLF